MTTDTLDRKKRIEDRLASHGIQHHITYLPYLDFDAKSFATPYEAGCRMIILYAGAFAASEPDERELIADWLKEENLWSHVTENEIEFFESKMVDERKIMDFSWQIECAYILAWALNLIKDTPTPTGALTDEQLDDFIEIVPLFELELEDFLTNLSYRDTKEIYDENLFHELATSYFRELMFIPNEDTSNIDRDVSYFRHKTLNWVRRFMDIDYWDETDTST